MQMSTQQMMQQRDAAQQAARAAAENHSIGNQQVIINNDGPELVYIFLGAAFGHNIRSAKSGCHPGLCDMSSGTTGPVAGSDVGGGGGGRGAGGGGLEAARICGEFSLPHPPSLHHPPAGLCVSTHCLQQV